jgi:hypothetical protein
MRIALRLAAVAAALLVTPLASAQPTPGAHDPVFSPERYRSHVEFLADDLLEGRETGTRGHRLAALYVAEQFRSLGLKPAGENGTWFQTVKLQERRLTDATPTTFTISGVGEARTFSEGQDALIGSSATEAATRFDAPLVFVGFGLDDRAHGFDAYRGLDVRGKIVVYLSGTPKGTPSEIGAHLNREKAAAAARRGAIGTIAIDTNVSERAFPWERRTRSAGLPAMTWMHADGTPYLRAPGIRASASLDRAAAEALFAGERRSLEQIRAEADRKGGKPGGFALRHRGAFELTSSQRLLESPNVLGMLEGSDPTLKSEVVLVMGHLDHLGTRPNNPGDKIYNGALDNASGIAAVIETARAFVESGERPRRSILFLAVTGEEKGLLGSDYFAEYPTLPLSSIAGVVNIDMPILTYDFGDIIAYGSDSSTLGQIVERAAAQIGVTLSPDPQPEQGIFTRSDHYNLVRRGVPAVFLKTGWHDAGGGLAGQAADNDFRTHRYHEPDDDLNQAIDWTVGAKFARVNWLIAREIANSADRPRWYQGDFFGDLFARDQPRAPKPAPASRP